MRKWILALKIIWRLIIQPSGSYFVIVEEMCKKELYKRPNDIYSIWLLSNHYVRYKKFHEAQILLESLVEIDRNRKSAILLLSKVYFKLENYEKVVELLINLEKLAAKDPENYYIGYSLIEMGRFEEAIKYLDRYVHHYAKDYVPFVRLGYAYYMDKRYDLALEAYIKANKLNPSENEIKNSIEMCKEKLKAQAGHC
jgi:tetratricopeptide (TPR) repeat protein